ncbi:MAG: porin [Pirellulaceae bacterium]
MFRCPIIATLAFAGVLFVNLTSGLLVAQDRMSMEHQGQNAPTPAAELNPQEPTVIDLGCDCGADAYCGCDEESGGWFINGWLSQGYTANPSRPASNFNNPLAFNDRSNDYQMNQLYLTMGKEVNEDGRGWDFGGRADLMYGTDYFFLESRGLERRRDDSRHWNGDGPRDGGDAALYGLAMPQLYVDAMIPVGSGLKARFGHFYTILGYESPMAPQNFFYSHSQAFVYGNPRTHTGALFSYSPTTCFTLSAGLTNGWDNFEPIDGQHGFLLGAHWDNDVESMSFSLHTGDETTNDNNNRFVYSSVYTRQLSQRLKFAFQHDLGVDQAGALDNNFEDKDAYWYGATSYLFLNLTRDFDVGLRAEWFRDEDNARIQQIPIEPLFSGGNYYNLSLGGNWRPTRNIMLRPEARYDWGNTRSTGNEGAFNDFEDNTMWTFAFDLIVSF